MPRCDWPLAAALVLSLAFGAAADGPAPRVLADFEETPLDRAGGDAVARPPSTVTVRRIPDGAGHALEVSGRQITPGLAGVSVTFYDVKAKRATSVDTSRYDYLTFRIRVTGSGPRLVVKLAGAAGTEKNEAMDAGEITRFLPQGLSGEWQQVAIPLGGLGIDRKALAALILVVPDPAEFTFAIDDVALKREPEDSLPPPRPRRGVP